MMVCKLDSKGFIIRVKRCSPFLWFFSHSSHTTPWDRNRSNWPFPVLSPQAIDTRLRTESTFRTCWGRHRIKLHCRKLPQSSFTQAV